MAANATAIDAALARATAALQAGRPDDAIRLTTDILAGAPDAVAALRLLGAAYLQCGRGAEAIAPLEAVARQSADSASETNLAMAFCQAGRLGDALPWLDRAASRHPEFPPAFQKLGLVLFLLDRPKDAEAPLRRAIDLAPRVAESWATLACVLRSRGDSGGARDAFLRALAEEPGSPDILTGLASALIDLGDFPGAEARLRELLAIVPGDPEIWMDRGFCLQELGRWDEALASYRDAVRASPRLFPRALKALSSGSRGRFWLKPSDLERLLRGAS